MRLSQCLLSKHKAQGLISSTLETETLTAESSGIWSSKTTMYHYVSSSRYSFQGVTNYNCSVDKFSVFRGVHLSVYTYDTTVPGLRLHWISSNASTCFTESGFGTFRTVALAPLAPVCLYSVDPRASPVLLGLLACDRQHGN